MCLFSLQYVKHSLGIESDTITGRSRRELFQAAEMVLPLVGVKAMLFAEFS